MSDEPRTVQDIIRSAKLPETTIELCLAGDLIADINECFNAIIDTRGLPETKRKRAESANRKLYARVDELRDEMGEAIVSLRLRARDKTRWRKLIDVHPPRKGNKGDAEAGVNLDSFVEAVLRESFVNEPELTPEDISNLFAVCPPGEYDRLTAAMWALNRGAVVIPKSPRELAAAQRSDDD